jgi:hypothetical protein
VFYSPTLPNVSSAEELPRRELPYQAFALFIDEGVEGYHIVDGKEASVPRFSDSDGSNLEIGTVPFEKVRVLWMQPGSRESYPTKSAKRPIQV